MMKWLKKINAIQTIDTSNSVKKADHNKKIDEIEKNYTNHDQEKYIATQEFCKLSAFKFAARLKEAKLATKNDIADFVKMTDFENKLKNFNKKVTLNKVINT